MTVGAAWDDATVEDHEVTTLVVTISRVDTCGAVSGLGFEIGLPGTLYRAQGTDTHTCASATISTTVGSGALAVSNVGLDDEVGSCTVSFPVEAEASGTYDMTTAEFTGVTGLAVSQTTQTLTVTTAPAKVGASIEPSTIDALNGSVLTMRLGRTDENAAAVSSGLGFQVNLPIGVTIGPGSQTNGCGGTLSAAVGASSFTVAGASLTGFPAECELTVAITSTIADTYSLDNTSITNAVGVEAHLTGGCESGRAEGACAPTLVVNLREQTVSFAQPADWSVSKHTVPLDGSASSTLPVTFSSLTPLVCTVSGSTATLLDAGTCTIAADQVGNLTYAAATQVTRSFMVSGPTPPPSNVVAVGGVSSLSVSWQVPDDVTGVTGYTAIAEPGPARCTTSSAAATSCVMGGQAGVTYTVTVITNHPLGDSAAAGPSNPATPTAPPIAAAPPDTDLRLTTDQGQITTAAPGQNIVVIGTGFMPYSTATIVVYSTPIVLGTVVTDGAGNFSKPVSVPLDLSVGGHTMVAAGIGPDGAPRSMKMAITVRARGGGLALTGAPIAAMLQLGLAALFGGGSLLLAGRRKLRL
ncbi:fibronectin type III domain-containing protein [Dactylosporangium sp. CA-092794]|uniref:fibronectin type III domain-containing protein n=1 Tax=Dactylosporangium sp. CA-092794 TaxID=3239929 RepID=UPI003D93C3D5